MGYVNSIHLLFSITDQVLAHICVPLGTRELLGGANAMLTLDDAMLAE